MIIYGWKRYVQVLAVLTLVCQQCALPAEHVLRKLTTKATLFFIPLFPISRKHTLTCSACEGEQKLSREQAHQLAASGSQQAPVRSQQGPPPPQPAYGQPRYQQGPPPMPAQPEPYGAQPPYVGQPSLPPMQRPYPGPPAGYPQQPGGYQYPPGR